MEENKKSKKGIVLGIIAVLIILGLVGYICYDKGLIFKSDKEVKEEKEKENKKEVKLDLKKTIVIKAEDILQNMTIASTYGEISDSIASAVFNEKELEFKNLNNNQKMYITLRNSNADIPNTCATEIALANISSDSLINSSIFKDTSYIDSFKSGKSFQLDEFELKYDSSIKSFAAGTGICGVEGPKPFDSFKITSAKKINDEVIVNINYAFFVPEGDMDIKYVIKETHDRKAKSIGDASDLKLDENHYPIVDENKCGKYQVKFKIDEDNLKLYIESIKKVS